MKRFITVLCKDTFERGGLFSDYKSDDLLSRIHTVIINEDIISQIDKFVGSIEVEQLFDENLNPYEHYFYFL